MQCESCGHDNPEGARFCAGCGGLLSSAGPNPTYPLLGKVVGGRYHILELIGEGGMGVVYKAEQRLGSTLRKVAVKTLHAELSRDPSITARFHREVGTIAQLEHPNTVRVYDFGSTDDGTLYIAMEFLGGRSLDKVIKAEGALDPKRVEHLLRQVAGSLDEAHRQGIVHRDLKPENVLLLDRAGEKDVVKLVDFGIAARTESADRAKEQKLTQQGMVLGTPPYMSPEQFTGKALDARSDIYSLGIMTYEMLTGQLPFQADTPWQWATHHMTSPPRSFEDLPGGSQLPAALKQTVLKALSKNPDDRQKSAGQLHAEFNAGLADGAVASPRPASSGGSGSKTEAMPEAQPFGVAATQAMPEASPAMARTAAVAAAPSRIAVPAAPPTERGGGNRNIVYGLSALGAILLLSMGVVALRSHSDSGPEVNADPPVARTESAPPPAADNAAAGDAPKEVKPESSPEPKGDGKSSRAAGENSKGAISSKPPAAKPSAPAPVPVSTPTPAVPATVPVAIPAPAATPNPASRATLPAIPPPMIAPSNRPSAPPILFPAPAPSPPEDADPCTACLKAAPNPREIEVAATMFSRCTDPAAKAQCTRRAAGAIPRQAEYAANNGRCKEAQTMVAAALQMGVPAARLAKAMAACK